MVVGVLREVKQDEYRVALTPAGARELVDAGHGVLVQRGAGTGSGFSDASYQQVGATIAESDIIWRESELVVKVKEPVAVEYECLQAGQVLFTYLHIAADPALTRALTTSGVTAIAYETVETLDGRLPLLAPMSEVAGRLAPQAGAAFLSRPLGGKGVLLGGTPGVAPGKVAIIGGGIVGYNAAVIALGLGADVTILERSIDRMRHLEGVFAGRVTLLYASALEIEDAVGRADLVVGAVLVPGARAPKLVSREAISRMTAGSVVVDVAIDQGGCFETSRPTTHGEPVYVDEGVIHYCVTNMPGSVPMTATRALTNATFAYIKAVADRGFRDAVIADPVLARGVNVVDGRVTYEAVAEAHGLAFEPLEHVIAH